MNEGQQRHESAQARERLKASEEEESKHRAQARERVHAAQERERQERQRRAAESQKRAEHRARVARGMPASSDPSASPPSDDLTTLPSANDGEEARVQGDIHANLVDNTTE